MPIKWNLKRYLAAKHHIYSAKELQRLVIKKTGIIISHANICKLVNNEPRQLNLKTVEIICSALSCELSDFFNVTPKNFSKKDNPRKLSPSKAPITRILKNEFPIPENYSEQD